MNIDKYGMEEIKGMFSQIEDSLRNMKGKIDRNAYYNEIETGKSKAERNNR